MKRSTAWPGNRHAPGQVAEEAEGEVAAPKSMFRVALACGQLGLAYLMLDRGYSPMSAVQDALDEQKFQLVLTLLSKCPDNSVIQQKNEQQQNLFHVLSRNPCREEHMKRIYSTLKERGVGLHERDAFGRAPLHYAAERGSAVLVRLLLEEGASALSLDAQGHSPLTLYMAGEKCRSLQLYDAATGGSDGVFSSLADAGAALDHLYPETCF